MKEFLRVLITNKKLHASAAGCLTIFLAIVAIQFLGLTEEKANELSGYVVTAISTIVGLFLAGQTVSDSVGKGRVEAETKKVEAEIKLEELKKENSPAPEVKTEV